MNIPTIDSLQIQGKIVILRGDLDVSIREDQVINDKRLEVLLPTINLLFEKGATKVLLIGHRGRPEGKPDEKFSLRPLVEYFKAKFSPDVGFIEYLPRNEIYQIANKLVENPCRLVILENMRFWSEEEENDLDFAEEFSFIGEVFVNEAFAASHRNHASVVGVPQKFREKYYNSVGAGLRFEEEIKNLSRVTENPERPLIAVISGLKKDKLDYIDGFKKFSDIVLIAGRLPEFLPEDYRDPRVLPAKLNTDKEDITIHSIEQFEDILSSAKTIVLAGPIGRYEDLGHRLGTQRVFTAVINSQAFKIAGGGDTETALETLNMTGKFDWISIGGGAMLEYLAKGILPGIEPLVS